MSDSASNSRAEMVLQFIEETLEELAQMAVKNGYRSLAATLTLAAQEAHRAASSGEPDPTH